MRVMLQCIDNGYTVLYKTSLSPVMNTQFMQQ